MSEGYSRLGALTARLATVRRLFGALQRSGTLWLVPLVLALLLLAALLAAIASTGPLAPFLYPLL
jgi:hypothetical protein